MSEMTQAIPVNIPSTLTLKVTHDEFVELATANRDLRLERTAEGELIVNPPTGGGTGKRNARIVQQLLNWLDREGTGEVFDSSTGFHLPNGSDRSPDTAWVSQERWNALTLEEQEGIVPLCPDFVVELRSKSDNLEPLRKKMREYIENKAQLGWLIDRKNRKVEIYRQNQEVEVLDNPVTLSGEDVLPGFSLDLTKVWNT